MFNLFTLRQRWDAFRVLWSANMAAIGTPLTGRPDSPPELMRRVPPDLSAALLWRALMFEIFFCPIFCPSTAKMVVGFERIATKASHYASFSR